MNFSNAQKLVILKLTHTLIWVFYNFILAYMFVAAWNNEIDLFFWVGLGFIIMECVILFVNKWTCPLTPLARKYTDSQKDNFDIYLPEWLAKNNVIIYSIIFMILVIVYFVK